MILAEQDRIRDRFPDTLAGELKLPSPRRNPGGRGAISTDTLGQRHREWVDGLGVRAPATAPSSTRPGRVGDEEILRKSCGVKISG